MASKVIYVEIHKVLVDNIDKYLAENPHIEMCRSAFLKFLLTFDYPLGYQLSMNFNEQVEQLYLSVLKTGTVKNVALRVKGDSIPKSSLQSIHKVCHNICVLGLYKYFK